MRAFILRRVELVAHGIGDAVLVGSAHSVGHASHQGVSHAQQPSLRVPRSRSRRRHPDVARSFQGRRGRRAGADLPRRGRAPEPEQSGDRRLPRLQRRDRSDARARCRDRRRRAVRAWRRPSTARRKDWTCWCSNRTRRADRPARARRSRTTSGFPTGISGQELAARAYTQAQKFGAQIMIAKGATQLTCDRKPYAVQIDDDTRVPARAVIIATGVEYRRPSLENLSQFEGSGVYYGATFVEAQLCGGEEVIVVGGGNSAGQAAVFLAQTAKRVHMLVRSDGLADSMSRYLIRRIEENPTIVLHTRTEIVALEGDDHLERVRWRDNLTGSVETHDDQARVRHDRRRAEHALARGLRGARRQGVHQDRVPTCRRTIWPRRAGRSPATRICSKRASPACSRSATCGAATSSASRRRSAKDRSPCRWCIRCCRNEGGESVGSGE